MYKSNKHKDIHQELSSTYLYGNSIFSTVKPNTIGYKAFSSIN